MLIGREELLHRLGDDELLVIDLRDEQAWRDFPVHIPGALRLSPTELSDHSHILPEDELIVLAGFGGDGADAMRALRLLQLRGRDPVVLEGGLRGWLEAGYPIEQHHDETSAQGAVRLAH